MGLDSAVTPPKKNGVELSSTRACPEGNGGPGTPGIWPGIGIGGAATAGLAGEEVNKATAGSGAEPGAEAGARAMDLLPIRQSITDMETSWPVMATSSVVQHLLLWFGQFVSLCQPEKTLTGIALKQADNSSTAARVLCMGTAEDTILPYCQLCCLYCQY